MKNKQFGGIMPAFITPFDENGALKADSARRLLERELSESQFLKLIELVECCEVQKLIVAYELGFRDETEAG